MNASMMANGGEEMSFDERLRYLSAEMSNVGNQSAFSKDLGSMNDSLNADIQDVANNVNKDIGLEDFRKEQAQVKKQTEHYKSKVLNKKVQDTHLSAFATDRDENGNILGKDGKIKYTAEQIKQLEQAKDGKPITSNANGQGKVIIDGESYQVVSPYNMLYKDVGLGNMTKGELLEKDTERTQQIQKEYQENMENIQNAPSYKKV